jgi:hypothetical protein
LVDTYILEFRPSASPETSKAFIPDGTAFLKRLEDITDTVDRDGCNKAVLKCGSPNEQASPP